MRHVHKHFDHFLSSENHKDYLHTFTTHFHDNILDLVDRAVEENQKVTGDHHYLEILSHLHLANIACSVFQGREKVREEYGGKTRWDY